MAMCRRWGVHGRRKDVVKRGRKVRVDWRVIGPVCGRGGLAWLVSETH